jgi:hypothetical protein
MKLLRARSPLLISRDNDLRQAPDQNCILVARIAGGNQCRRLLAKPVCHPVSSAGLPHHGAPRLSMTKCRVAPHRLTRHAVRADGLSLSAIRDRMVKEGVRLSHIAVGTALRPLGR